MNPTKIISVMLVVAGALGLAYGGVSYTQETTGLKVGQFELNVREKKDINFPLAVSVCAISLGVFLLVAKR
jgi:hypothetical protein